MPLRMNTIPLPRETRHHFYDDVSLSLFGSVQSGAHSRMMVLLEIPETNPRTDVYRVGTVLEAVRALVGKLAQDGKRVKICVQGSMGRGVYTGLPLQLSGLRKVLELMDWQEEVEPFVSFGEVGPEECADGDDIFIVISPMNMVGASIIPRLQGMCEAAGERPVILLNPNLTDVPSAEGLMGVRGRKERLEFAASFEEVYHFRLLYRKPYLHPGEFRRKEEPKYQRQHSKIVSNRPSDRYDSFLSLRRLAGSLCC